MLAVRWCGKAGAFAGYETLEIREPSGVSQGEVTFTARIVSVADGSHRVELEAWRSAGGASGAARDRSALIVKGEGLTLEVGASAPATTATSISTLA